MIVLDTNVLSEAIRSAPSEAVRTWLDRQPRGETYATAISRAEMLAGVRVLPEGRRRETLSLLIDELFVSQFGNALLPFDAAAADRYADVVAVRKQMGRPIGIMDAQIAAIALSRNAAVATRDSEDFSALIRR